MANELTVEIRAGTSKLKGDIKDASSIISQLYNSGQASSGSGRPSSAASTGGFPGSIKEYEDQIAKQESKAKASKYSSEAVSGGGGIGGGGINASGTKAIQINKAVINVAAAKINIVKSKSGLGSGSADVGGGIPSAGGAGMDGGGGAGGGGASPSYRSMFTARPGEAAGDAFGRTYSAGAQMMNAAANPYMSYTDLNSMLTGGVSGAYNLYKDYKSRKAPTSEPHTTSREIKDHHSAHIENSLNRHREDGSRTVGMATSAGSAVPIVGAVVGAAVGAYAAQLQKYAEARISLVTSQLSTAGNVGIMAAGGTGSLGVLGYSAAAKGQMIQQSQQHMTSRDFVASGGMAANEERFAFSAKFGHAMGIGAGQGMAMSSQLSEINQYGKYSKMGGEAQLKNVAGYARGFEGGNSRRLGAIAQFVTNLSSEQQSHGGGGDTTAIAASLSRLRGHSLRESQHAVSGLSQAMSGGVNGSPISGMLMLAAAQRGDGLNDVLKAGDKGITKQGINDLKGMIPKELMPYVMMGQGSNMTQSEHMTQAIYGKASYSDVDAGTMGGTYSQKSQDVSNTFAFEQEILGMGQAAHAAAAGLKMLHEAGKSVSEFYMSQSPYAGKFKGG